MKILFDNRVKSIGFSGTAAALLRKLRVRREEVVIRINGKLAPETKKIEKNDKVEVIKVVFGG